ILKDDDPPEAVLEWIPGLFRWGMQVEVPQPRTWAEWSAQLRSGSSPFDRPLILLIDEFDKLPPAVLHRMVGMFRDVYLTRQTAVLHALALVGVRAVMGVENESGSPFNIQQSLQVPNLTRDEVAEMFAQYEAESGQRVLPEVVAKVFETTRGQPGLVSWFGEL